ncbi:MAG: hydrogenase formation protein HypD [bacterium]|nr:hydrogenase formation protein HypD [bacterium]
MKYIDDYRNPETAKFIVKDIKKSAKILQDKNISVNIMEVCGSHTMAIARFGIRDLLPENINLISGPGCPVCVTDSGYIDTAVKLAESGVIIATFGDMINVPGSEKTLAKCRAEGCRIEVCYSPISAIDLAKENPDKEVVFLAIGFETTMAPIISMIDSAAKESIENISILTAFKLVPPVLEALTSDPELRIDAFLCPAHVSAIIGEKAYEPFVEKYKIPCVIASFEPVDILLGLNCILKQIINDTAEVENRYKRVVTHEGNTTAVELINKYLEPYDAAWRGIGIIPESGLKLKEKYSNINTESKLNVTVKKGKPNNACKCGDVLKGKIKPDECPLFGKACSPVNPIGPCMVSSEGSCAAYFKYSRH